MPDIEIGTNSGLNWKQLFWTIWPKANVPIGGNDDLSNIILIDSIRQAFYLEEGLAHLWVSKTEYASTSTGQCGDWQMDKAHFLQP